MKIIKRKYYGAHNLANCQVCSWQGQGGKEARKHCRETGHDVVVEYGISTFYSKEKK